MRLTPDQLSTITATAEFQRLPMILLEDKPSANWRAAREDILDLGVSCIAWEAHHRLSYLFEVYGDVLETVGLEFYENDGSSSSYIQLNGYRENADHFSEMFNYVSAREPYCYFHEVDKMRAIQELAEWLKSVNNKEIENAIGLLNQAFYRSEITSATHAQLLASEKSPLVDAWVKRHLLNQTLSTSPEMEKRAVPHL